jgi:ATP-binding cassette subfamily B multidrug efflux pump
MMFRAFETIIDPTATPGGAAPPNRLLPFFWHYVRQARWVFASLVLVSVALALLETTIPYFIGRLVDELSHNTPDSLIASAWPLLALMAFVVIVARPAVTILQRLIINQTLVPPFTTLVRWQSHHHIVRQALPFFQNDFAGRIANRVMQSGMAVRETVISLVRSVLHILIYGLGALALMAAQDLRLAAPTFVWFAAYVGLLAWMVPRQRDLSRKASEARSLVTGKVVDSYTNILTVKLFAKARDEDNHVRESMVEMTDAFHDQQRMGTTFLALLTALNAVYLTATAAVALALWQDGEIGVGVVAMVLPLTVQIIAMSGWVSFEVSGIFENIGLVQESMISISKPHTMTDRPGARELAVEGGGIRFEKVSFAYPGGREVIEEFDLDIAPGEKIGLVGRSGAGKSTLVNLLLRFHDVSAGRILIDGQDTREVTQESLRSAISVVTQDVSLLHRSIRENILYGRRGAGEAAMIDAARRAEAHAFIEGVSDWNGRRGYDAHVGERGVKLSGGQRQRIAIARVILKDAPILVLDEATSALDSEVEAAIQSSLAALMADKTVIAIAHRLSTLQIMDRIVVIDEGRIVEQGSHAALLARGGLYADLWARQSGGFLPDDALPLAAE